MTAVERDYVLGTHDEEVSRLALQHRVWRPRALDAWRRAGFTAGQTLLDLGCGPGWASLDLAEITGPAGRVIAVDRSRRFLVSLEATAARRGLSNIETAEIDLDTDDLPAVAADGAWTRWVVAFLARPRDLLARVRAALRPGGVFVIHEYFDYRTWRVTPRSEDLEQFVSEVMSAWRANGGEPDIGLDLPRWLEESGFRIVETRPIVDFIRPSDFAWQWPKSFIENGVARLVEIGRLTPDRGRTIREAFAACEAMPHARMVTPAVLEIIAST